MNEIPHQWLRYSGTPEDFERARLKGMAASLDLPFEKVARRFSERPFGAMTDAWRKFVQQLDEQDELWFFSSSDDSFGKGLGCQGYAIVRNGLVRDTLITLRT